MLSSESVLTFRIAQKLKLLAMKNIIGNQKFR